MLNQQKIRCMTKAAAFEDREDRGYFKMNRYFRVDYIIFGMIKSAVAVTVGAALVVLVWGLIHAEELLTGTALEDFFDIGRTIGTYYAIALIVSVVIAFIVYLVRYQRMRKSMKQYLGLLKTIQKMNEQEEKSTWKVS